MGGFRPGERDVKRTKVVSKKKCLFIEELERPAMAEKAAKCDKVPKGGATTLAIGEECTKTV